MKHDVCLHDDVSMKEVDISRKYEVFGWRNVCGK